MQRALVHTYQPEELNLIDKRVTLADPVIVNGRVKTSGSEVRVSGRIETQHRIDIFADS